VLFRVGVYLLLVTALLWTAFSLLSAHEQALDPGQKSFGVAVLAIIFLPAILLIGTIAASMILVTASILAYKRLVLKS